MSSHRATIAELAESLQAAAEEVPVDSVWRHYRDNKGETLYTVTGHAIIEANETVAVLYQNPQGIVFSRPLTEFVETVRGGTQKRFQKIIF